MPDFTGFLVVWSLFSASGEGMPPAPASSHHYWSQAVCEGAKIRFNDSLNASGSAPADLRCVPFMKKTPPQF